MERLDNLTIPQGRLLCIISFIVSRFVYLGRLRFPFDESPLTYFVQYVDPQLLKTKLWESLYYLWSQPPGFNLLLGIVLKAFPKNHAAAFQFLFICFGVVFALSLFTLMVQLGVPSWISTALTIIFSCSPAVLYYENWLFYTYPTAALLCLAAVLLHRFAASTTLWNGLSFFSVLTLIAYIRGLFHLSWFIFFCLWLLYFFPQQRKKVALAFSLPLLALVALYAKNYFVFGSLNTGNFYLAINVKAMSYYKIPAGEHRSLIAQGKLTRLSLIHAYPLQGKPEDYMDIIGAPEKSGVAVLDQVRKSTGAINFNYAGFLKVVKPISQDNMYFLRERPDVYLQAVVRAYGLYLLPASETWRFNHLKERLPGVQILDRLYSLLLLGQRTPSGPAYFLAVGFPLLLAFGFYAGAKAYRRRDMATSITVVFLVANILYVTLVTTLFSEMDHNRYRFKVDGFYLVLLGLAISSGATAIQALWRKEHFQD